MRFIEEKKSPKKREKPSSSVIDGIVKAIGMVSLCIVLMIASCTYMGWDAVRRAHNVLRIPDMLFSGGETHNAVEQYKTVFPELVTPDQRSHALKRIISHEYGVGDEEEASFWSDLAAEEGMDLREELGGDGSPVRELISNSYERWERKRERGSSSGSLGR